MSVPSKPIPQPKTMPLLGNLPALDAEKGIFGLVELAERYGPIYRLELPHGEDLVVASSQELANELCDEQRFDKKPHQALRNVLCSSSYRFNSLYSAQLHPFVGAMVRSLVEAGERGRRRTRGPASGPRTRTCATSS